MNIDTKKKYIYAYIIYIEIDIDMNTLSPCHASRGTLALSVINERWAYNALIMFESLELVDGVKILTRVEGFFSI